MVFVSDSDMKSPLVVLINDFSGPNSPFVIAEGSPKTVEVVWAATKLTCDVCATCGGNSEPDRLIVFGEQAVAFTVVHHYRVQLVNVWGRATPVVVFVIEIRFDFTECLVDDELAGVFDVIGGINNSGFRVVPLLAFFVKTIGFVTDASCFETAVLQVVATPRLDI